jgi:sodium-dependent dicarboxylate transporter 2/3/5
MGTATATLSPVGHPANLMVMGLGGYRFRDYAALGFPLVLIAGAGVLLLIPRLYPF